MAAIKLTSFSGIAPRIQNRQLPENMGQLADNCRLTSGALESWAQPLAVAGNDLASGDVLTIFKMTNGVTDYWLSWTRDVNCAPSLIAGDDTQRIYYTGDGEPRISNLAMAISGGTVMPAGFFVLGVPAPLVAPTVTPSGGTGATVSRAYCETFVTSWGEESAPSPASSVTTGKIDDTWALTALNAAPINTSTISGAAHSAGVVTVTTSSTKYMRVGEEITIASIVGMTDLNGKRVITEVTDTTHFKVALTTAQTYTSGGSWTRVAAHNTSGMTRRIYRSLNGAYKFVAEIAIGTTTYNDTVTDANLGETIPSADWDMPPTDLVGLTSHPGGFYIGVSGNEICMSEPWRPHAWPIAYRQTVKFMPSGVGVYGSSIVVCTAGTPYILNGSHPDSLSMEQTEIIEPCVSKRSIVDVGAGIMYASPNGYVFIGPGGSNVTTRELLTRRDWQEFSPETIHCAYHDGMVIGLSAVANAAKYSGFVFDSKSGAFSPLSVLATATYLDPEDGSLYLVSGGVLKKWGADQSSNTTFDWKSKAFSLPKPVNLGYAQVDADYAYMVADQAAQLAAQLAADIAWNTALIASGKTGGELGESILGEYTLSGSNMRSPEITDYATRFLRFQLYADGVLKYTETVINRKPFAMPAGYKSALYEVRISGNVPVFGASIAETAAGLRNV